MQWYRQASGTTVGSGPTIPIGPVLDSAGAEYNGLVIGDLTLSKNGTEAAMAANATLTNISNGHYSLVMIGNNVDTLGRFKIRSNKLTYQFPTIEGMVLPAMVYDSLVAGTDNLQIDLTQIDGQLTNGNNAVLNLKQLNIVNNAGSAFIATASGGNGNGAIFTGQGTGVGLSVAGPGSTGFRVTGTTAVSFIGAGGSPGFKIIGGATGNALELVGGATSGDGLFCSVTAGIGLSPNVIRDATAQGGTGNSIQLDAGASATDNIYRWCVIRTVAGTGAGQSRLCTAYVGATKQASVVPNWLVNPDATTRFQVCHNNGAVDIATIRTSTPNALIGGRFDSDVGNIQAAVLTAIATAVEAAILNEGDATPLLAAIAAKVETFLINEGDASATLTAIAAAVRANLTAELARILLALPAFAPNTADGLLTSDQMQDKLDDVIGNVRVNMNTDHGNGSYVRNTEPDDSLVIQDIQTNVNVVITNQTTFYPTLDNLQSLIVDNAGWQFDAHALALAPTGGGTAPTVEEIDTQLSLTHGAGSWESVDNTGPGATLCTINIHISGVPVADADVWLTSDEDGNTVVAGTLQTDSNGNVSFMLDVGSTYYVWMQKDGVDPILGAEYVASAG